MRDSGRHPTALSGRSALRRCRMHGKRLDRRDMQVAGREVPDQWRGRSIRGCMCATAAVCGWSRPDQRASVPAVAAAGGPRSAMRSPMRWVRSRPSSGHRGECAQPALTTASVAICSGLSGVRARRTVRGRHTVALVALGPEAVRRSGSVRAWTQPARGAERPIFDDGHARAASNVLGCCSLSTGILRCWTRRKRVSSTVASRDSLFSVGVVVGMDACAPCMSVVSHRRGAGESPKDGLAEILQSSIVDSRTASTGVDSSSYRSRQAMSGRSKIDTR